jgi:protein-L-isoaspartate(D-aspartate) O-methyltransferase
MVETQLRGRGIRDEAVLAAMRTIARHQFVDEVYREFAYDDGPLPIGADQTISQPHMVALMSELAQVGRGDKVLEVGTGCGYQTAVLAHLGAQVFSIESVGELLDRARERLSSLGYHANLQQADGAFGWPAAAPFAAILVTAAAPTLPSELTEQLAIGGRLVIPLGRADPQYLVVVTRTERGYEQRRILAVRFVRMTGQAQQHTEILSPLQK